MPGRSVTDNLVLVRDMIEYARSNNRSLILDSIHLEKAFDRVVHRFLFLVLEAMGFPNQLLQILRGLYKDCSSRVLVNGVVSERFEVNAGVRQGCPVPPIVRART